MLSASKLSAPVAHLTVLRNIDPAPVARVAVGFVVCHDRISSTFDAAGRHRSRHGTKNAPGLPSEGHLRFFPCEGLASWLWLSPFSGGRDGVRRAAARFGEKESHGARGSSLGARCRPVPDPPSGFNVSEMARLAGVRFMAIAPDGEIVVAHPDYGTVWVIGTDGLLTTRAYGLRAPHALAFDAADDETWLYIVEEHRVVRYLWSGNEKKASAGETNVDNLPTGGHNLKNIAIELDH